MKKNSIIALLIAMVAMSAQAQLLYKISGKGLTKPSYIIGTYHLADVKFVDSIPGLKKAMDETTQVYGELDMSDMMSPENLMKMQAAMMLPEGQTLQGLLKADQLERLNAGLKKIMGMDMRNPMISGQLGKMKPAALSTQLSVLLFMQKHQGTFDPQNLFDQYFQKQALAAGKQVGGLETIDTQMKVLFDMQTLERQTETLMCFIDNMDYYEKMAEEISKAFYLQNIESIDKTMNEKLNNSCDNRPEETDALIANRNADWFAKMPAIMQEAPTFFAVGAGHLPGEKGVLALLKKAGYKVEGMK